ncbi:DUF3386 domain-containing protein [Chlorogloeopsis sp. ULAP02]|uniref:DUF3386 domain-containing protein n=1 Tax=Chlorogloeopsis sp. ULAP02 TaxID=3107926 RepID=UPI0031358066
MAPLKTARELFQTAYASRYTWDANFPGYSADVQVVQGGKVYTGKICINRDKSIKVTEVNNEEVEQGIYTQLQDIITHRQPTSFEESYGNYEFIQGEIDDTGAVNILVKDESTESYYKIRGKEFCQVRQVMGRMAFEIDTHASLDTGSGYVATCYDAIFRNRETNEVKSILKFEDTFEKIGEYYILAKQIVQDCQARDSTTTEFSYSNIKLIKPAAV